MDRTAEFRLLANAAPSDGSVPAPCRPVNAFMRAAGEQQQRLSQLRHRLQFDSGQKATAVQACKEEMSRSHELANLIEDTNGLSPQEMRQRGQLLEHRRALLWSLSEDMQSLVSSVQSAQVSELQHEAEVAGYFHSSPSKTLVAPPPVIEEPDLWRSDAVGGPGDDAVDAEVSSLLMMFSNDMDQIQETQKKTQEVSALVTQFAMEVANQQQMIENVTELAEESIEHIKQAEGHLQQAVKNSNSYRFYVVCWFTGSAIFLLIFDYLDSRMPI